MFRFVLLVQAIALMAVPAQANSFRALNGVVLPAPDLNVQTCGKLSQLMTTYMASHYRDVDIVPEDHPDRPIYDYEHRLAEIHYEDCQMGSNHFEDSSSAFSKGFN